MKYYLGLFLCVILVVICPCDINGQVITTIAGDGLTGYTGDGSPASAATFHSPSALAIDAAGNLYISDQQNNCVRKITKATGIITTVAGNGSPGSLGDNGQATAAQLHNNWGIALDGTGNLYITDEDNHKIRKVNSATGIITTFAGTGTPGNTGNGGLATAADLNVPIGIAVDPAGNVFVGDEFHKVIRKISTSGIISLYAGVSDTAGYRGDGGPAWNALFRDIFGLAEDASGNLYICDWGNNCIRKINSVGIISTVAGTGVAGFSGDNGPATLAKLNRPTGVFPDDKGNIYIVDAFNQRIRKVNSAGVIKTIAGSGTPGFAGDGGAALAAKFNNPVYAVADDSGSIYVSDGDNERIRKIYKVLTFDYGPSHNIEVCQKISSPIDSALLATDLTTGHTVTWTVVTQGVFGHINGPHSAISNGGAVMPSGFSYTPYSSTYYGIDSFKMKVADGLDSDIIIIHVNIIPTLTYAGVIEGPSIVCVGQEITLTDTMGNGKWTIVNLNAIVTGGVVKGESPGTDTVIYTISNACGSVSTSKEITIFPLPDPGIITGTSPICVGSQTFLSNSIAGGYWGVTNNIAGINSSGLVKGLFAGKDTVTYTVSSGICTNQATFILNVITIPTAVIHLGDSSICVDRTTSLLGSPNDGIWNLSNGNATISPGFIYGNAAGTVIVSYIASNICGSDTAYAALTINPLPSQPAISQVENTLSVPPVYAAYQWLLNGAKIPGAIADTYVVSTTGNYSITVLNSFGCSLTTDSLYSIGCTVNDINIYPNPSNSIIYIKWCREMKIKLMCMDGKEIEIEQLANQVDLGILPNGVYLLSVYDASGNKLKTKKIVKTPY